MKKICVLSIPRSGTNHLCKLMSSLDGVRAHFDLFNKDASYTLDKLELAAVSEAAQIAFEDFRDIRLIQFARQNPARYLHILETANAFRASCLSFKIFPSQLDKSILRSQILTDKNIVFVFVKRRLLDSYISARKAAAVGKYTNVSTSEVSVRISPVDYLRWVGMVVDWFSYCETVLRKFAVRFGTLHYEEDIEVDSELALERLLSVLQDCELQLAKTVTVPTGLEKQDSGVDYERKIANWSEFVASIESFGVVPRTQFGHRHVPVAWNEP